MELEKERGQGAGDPIPIGLSEGAPPPDELSRNSFGVARGDAARPALHFTSSASSLPPWQFTIRERSYVGRERPRSVADFLPVIEHALRFDEEFVQETCRSLFQADYSCRDLQDVTVSYQCSGGLKHFFLVNARTGTGMELEFSVKPTRVGICLEDRDSIISTIGAWQYFSRNPEIARYLSRYGSSSTVYFENFYCSSILISQEYVPGPTLREIMDEEGSSFARKTQAVRKAFQSYVELREKFSVAISDPKPENTVAVNGSIFEWKLIDLDKLRTGSDPLTRGMPIEEYLAVLLNYYSEQIPADNAGVSKLPKIVVRGWGNFSPREAVIVSPRNTPVEVYFSVDTSTALPDPEPLLRAQIWHETEPHAPWKAEDMVLVNNYGNGLYRFGACLPAAFSGEFTYRYSVDGGLTWIWANRGPFDNRSVVRS